MTLASRTTGAAARTERIHRAAARRQQKIQAGEAFGRNEVLTKVLSNLWSRPTAEGRDAAPLRRGGGHDEQFCRQAGVPRPDVDKARLDAVWRWFAPVWRA